MSFQMKWKMNVFELHFQVCELQIQEPRFLSKDAFKACVCMSHCFSIILFDDWISCYCPLAIQRITVNT